MSFEGQPRLTARQERILRFVVQEYVATGQPIGSKTLVSRTGMGVSSSTVRYELAELEGRGFLTHPHTSAGRVPTDGGYRFFVDGLLESPGPPAASFELELPSLPNEIEEALRLTTEALGRLTHLLALVTAPSLETTVVRRVEVLLLQPQVVVVVVITSTGGVAKQIFVFEEAVDLMLVDWAAEYLNETVSGQKLSPRLLRSCFEDPGLSARERAFLDTIRPAFDEMMESGAPNVFVGGAAGLLEELRDADMSALQRLLEGLEERATLLGLMRQTLLSRRPFVRFGSELGDPALASISLVGAAYGLSHRNLGTVGIVGPIRMDYVKAIHAVKAAASQLSRYVEVVYEE